MIKEPPKMKSCNEADEPHYSIGNPVLHADGKWYCECLDCHLQFEWDEKAQQWRALLHGFGC